MQCAVGAKHGYESRNSEFRVYEQDGENGQIRAKVNERELLRDSQ